MTAPGVGVRGRIRPPGIPSSAVTPRGFSSLSHERDAVAAHTQGVGTLVDEAGGFAERGFSSGEEAPWAPRRAMLLALTLAGWSGSGWQCQPCIPCLLAVHSSWVLSLWP